MSSIKLHLDTKILTDLSFANCSYKISTIRHLLGYNKVNHKTALHDLVMGGREGGRERDGKGGREREIGGEGREREIDNEYLQLTIHV